MEEPRKPKPADRAADSPTPPAHDQTIAPKNAPQPGQPSPSEPREFGDYELLEEIARGGMGVVYRARQKRLNRIVALKMILAGQLASQEDVERFHVEAIAAANLDHEAIVPIYEIGQHDGNHFFSMKLIEGGHLGEKIDEYVKDTRAGVTLMAKVCRAIEHAHRRGILHRDLKPENILVDKEGEPFVTDLGLARHVEGHKNLTMTGAVIGTPSYMSPEQAMGKSDVTVEADIYSLGALLYKVICGRPPFEADSVLETLMQVMNGSPPELSDFKKVDKSLEQIVMKCLAKEPAQRYTTAGALADDLEKWLRGETVSIIAPSLASMTRGWLKQNFGRLGWAFLIGPMFGIVSGICAWQATIHRDISSVMDTYDMLPSAQRPWLLFPYDTPLWMSVTLMILFAVLIVFIGFITVIFVKPKNRSADLAVGTLVGLFASIAGYIFCFGSLSIVTTEYSEHDSIIEILNQDEPSSFGTSTEVYSKYPELLEYSTKDQIALLLRKESNSRIFSAPRGIWLGVIASLAVYFIPCLFEAYVAGPLLRKHKSWSEALLPYIETAFPVAILLTIFAVMFSCWLIYGNVGVLPSWSLLLLFLLIVIAALVRRSTWHAAVRFAVLVGVAVVFGFFVVNDFLYVPNVSTKIAKINELKKRFEEMPEDVSTRINLSDENEDYANTLVNMNRRDQALEAIDESI